MEGTYEQALNAKTYKQALDCVLEMMLEDGGLEPIFDAIQNSVELETALWMDLEPIEVVRLWLEKAVWKEPYPLPEEAIVIGNIIMETVKHVTELDLQYEVIPDYADINNGYISFYLVISKDKEKIVRRPCGCLYWYCGPSSLDSILALAKSIAEAASKV